MYLKMRTQEKLAFKEYKIEGFGYSIYAAFPTNRVNLKETDEALEREGLVRAPTGKILLALHNDSELKESSKGRWGYAAEEGIDNDGVFAFNKKTGELEKPKGGESIEDLVSAWSGKWLRRVVVRTDGGAEVDGGRYDVVSDYRPDDAASVVFGIKPDGAAPVAKALRV